MIKGKKNLQKNNSVFNKLIKNKIFKKIFLWNFVLKRYPFILILKLIEYYFYN